MSVRAQHVVLFKFGRELSSEEEAEMFTRVRSWPAEIKGLTGLRIGKDVGGRSEGFSYLLLTEFEDEESHQAYYPHPAHVAFSDWVKGLGCEVIRVDYPLTEESLVI